MRRVARQEAGRFGLLVLAGAVLGVLWREFVWVDDETGGGEEDDPVPFRWGLTPPPTPAGILTPAEWFPQDYDPADVAAFLAEAAEGGEK